jgi:hypothetical protein
MSTNLVHTILITTATICLAALLAVANSQHEHRAGHGKTGFGLLADALRSR